MAKGSDHVTSNTATSDLLTTDSWTPDSWRDRPAQQQPDWDPAELATATAEISRLPCLVQPVEIVRLRRRLADAAKGRAFVVQAGDCAESFDDVTTDHVTRRSRLITELAARFRRATGVEPLTIGRIAGQFAKPRSTPTELVDGQELPVFRGHMVNGPEPSPAARRADAGRLIRAYYQSAATLNLLRAIEPPGQFWVSREALLLPYERATLRQHPASGAWMVTSTHFPWIGERTRALDGAHVELLRGTSNPIAVKLGPTTTPDMALALCDRLNPRRLPGRLTFVTRIGPAAIGAVLPGLVAAVAAERHPVVWMCDPMHANTIRTSSGLKTRRMDDVVDEIDGWFDVLAAAGRPPGGIHLECSPDDVHECVDSSGALDAVDGTAYRSLCDPRLNTGQAVAVVRHAAHRYRAHRHGWAHVEAAS